MNSSQVPALKQSVSDFFSTFPQQELPAKTVVLQEQVLLDSVYYIEEGVVCVKLLHERGNEVIVNILRAPSFFPLTAIVNDTPNVYQFEAKTDLTIRIAPIGKVRKWLQSDLSLLWETLSRVLVGMNGQLEEKAVLMVGTSKQRLLQVLIQLSRRFGAESGDTVVVSLPFTHAELASLIGISRETVTREISVLKDEGVIQSIQTGVIQLSFPELLEATDTL